MNNKLRDKSQFGNSSEDISRFNNIPNKDN